MIVQQCIHGYSDGHRLLESSTDISKTAQRELAILSDLSGNAGGQTFEPYFTGYPLPSEELYALAMTWPAPEMPRPGCVWTHTLLLDFKSLPIHNNLNGLLALFRRPVENDDFESYHNKVSIEDTSEYIPFNNLFNWVPQLVELLYDSDSSILLIGDNPGLSKIILQTWAQRWSSLQKQYRFCTLSISPRKSSDHYFDLQSVSTDLFRKSKWTNSKIIIFDTDSKINHDLNLVRNKAWIHVVSKDLENPNCDKLREYLDLVGPDFNENLSYFKKLAQVYAEILNYSSDKSIQSLIDIVGKEFPKTEQAESLKSWLIEQKDPLRRSLLPNASRWFVLYDLLNSPYQSAFNLDFLDLPILIIDFWENADTNNKNKLISLAWANADKSLSISILSILAKSLAVDEIIEIGLVHSKLIPFLLTLNPLLLSDVKVWCEININVKEFKNIANIVAQLEPSESRAIVHAAIESGANFAANELEIALGSNTAIWIIEWADTQSISELNKLGKQWRMVIRKYANIVLTSLAEAQDVSEKSVILIAKSIGITTHNKNSAKMFAKVIEKHKRDVQAFDTPTKIFLLNVGLSESGKYAAQLISFSFDAIHESLLLNRMSPQEWDQIQSKLPSLGIWDTWDKAERLRRGVTQWFVYNSRPLEELLFVTDDKKYLEQLLRSVLRTINGREYLVFGFDKINSYSGKKSVHSWKIKLVKKIIASYW